MKTITSIYFKLLFISSTFPISLSLMRATNNQNKRIIICQHTEAYAVGIFSSKINPNGA